jgi:hypothetical protein
MKAAADKAKQAADAARKAAAKASFYLFFSMLIGAFIASVSVRRHCESFESVTGWWDGGLKRASQL